MKQCQPTADIFIDSDSPDQVENYASKWHEKLPKDNCQMGQLPGGQILNTLQLPSRTTAFCQQQSCKVAVDLIGSCLVGSRQGGRFLCGSCPAGNFPSWQLVWNPST